MAILLIHNVDHRTQPEVFPGIKIVNYILLKTLLVINLGTASTRKK